MKDLEALHNKAMELSDLALLAKRKGDFAKFEELSLQALDYEASAANGLRDQFQIEPTRSILYRSAASIAIDCRQFRYAEILISTALIGTPSEELAEELRDLLEQANFRRHLELRGIELNPGQMQLSIAGKAIGSGIARGDEVLGRVQSVQMILHRTIERLLRRPYRRSGSFDDSLGSVFVSAPRAGSFAISISVGINNQLEQGNLFNKQKAQSTAVPDDFSVIDEVVSCLSLLNDTKEDELRSRMESPEYFENFLELSYDMAPNGESVSLIGITTSNYNEEKRLEFRRTRRDISLSIRDWKARMRGERVTIRGSLRLADTVKNSSNGRIILIDDDKRRHTILASQKDISDKMIPLWSSYVKLTGKYNNEGHINFEKIEPYQQNQKKE